VRRQGAHFGQGYLYAKARPEISVELGDAPRASQLKRA
jgi:sensor c-di-GMP phosphodiesterase-like protein